MRLRAAVAHIDAVLIECPNCGELIDSPDNGSLMWDRSTYETVIRKGGTTRRLDCGQDCKLPVNAFGPNKRK